jgi:hypothetical protein
LANSSRSKRGHNSATTPTSAASGGARLRRAFGALEQETHGGRVVHRRERRQRQQRPAVVFHETPRREFAYRRRQARARRRAELGERARRVRNRNRNLRVFFSRNRNRDERLSERDPRVFALSLGVAERVHERFARERRRERAPRRVPVRRVRRQEPHDAGGVDDAAFPEPIGVRFAPRDERRGRRRSRDPFVVVFARRVTLVAREVASVLVFVTPRVVRPAAQVRGHLREAQERLVVDGVAPAGAHGARVAERARRQIR